MFKLQEQLKEKDRVIERASWIIQQLQIKLQGDSKENISQLTTARTLNETKRGSQININEQLSQYKQNLNDEKNIYDWITKLINDQSLYFKDFNLNNLEQLLILINTQQTYLNTFKKQTKQMDYQIKEYIHLIESLQYQLSTCKDNNQMLIQMIKRLLSQKDYNCLQILFHHQVLEQTDIFNQFIIFNQGHQQLTIKCGQLNHQYQLSSAKQQQNMQQNEIQNYKIKLNEYEQMIQEIQYDNKQLLDTLNKSIEEVKLLEIQNQELYQQQKKQEQKDKQQSTQLIQLGKIRADYEYMSNQNPKLLDMKSICKNQFQSILYLINFLEEEKIISIKLLNEMSAQMRQLRNYFKEL
ncbi:hypothetical protein pb186bvf_011964 [Paramecium bursaria]